MVLFRARSILQLTVFGFLAVAALLIVALLISAGQLGQLADRSQATTSQAAEAMRVSRRLIEHTSAMERNARQYTILNDAALLGVYEARRLEFISAVERLTILLDTHEVEESAANLLSRERDALEILRNLTDDLQADSSYPPLLESAYAMSAATSAWVDDQATLLQEQTRETQQALNLQTALLVAAALALAAFFVMLIIRPLKQMDAAIKGLGSGAYESPIEVQGPRDLQLLGQRLEWLRSRLETLEQQRNAFLRHVSHELKTPLAAMRESAALLGEGIAGPVNAEQAEIISILNKNCQRLLGLIEDLLRHNASSFAILEVMPQAINMKELVETVVASHELALKSAGIEVSQNLEKLVVSGDREQVRVVLDNLLSNAVKFSPSYGQVAITLKRDDDVAVLDVRDEGPGIDNDEKDKVFAAFFQGKRLAREGYKGTGLGLAIAQEYTRANGGQLTLEETSKGAWFRVRLPLAADG